jgi:uncharacterized protein involved in outer membrane biogenesis
MKLLKILVGIIVTFILLFIAGIVVLVTLINPNDFRDKITTVVHQETGRDLKIGNISWSFFPWLGIKVNNVALDSGADFNGQNFINIGEAGLRVEFLPIFRGKIKVGTLTLKNADIVLTKNKAGKTNWQDFLAVRSNKQQNSEISNQAAAKGAAITLVSISNVNVSNTNVSWYDAVTGQKIVAQNLNLYCKDIEVDPSAQDVSTQLSFQGNIGIGQFIANTIHISDIKTQINFAAGVLNLKPFLANFYGGKFSGNITINLKNKIPSIAVEESLTNLQLKPLLTDLAATSNLDGTADIGINITTSGIDSAAILKNLNGKANIKVVNGVLKGVDINAIVMKAESLIRQTHRHD